MPDWVVRHGTVFGEEIAENVTLRAALAMSAPFPKYRHTFGMSRSGIGEEWIILTACGFRS